MCEYCRKFTQRAHILKTGYDVTIDYEGEVYIDFFNNLIVYLENNSNMCEVSLSIKYCPWCGDKLKERKDETT